MPCRPGDDMSVVVILKMGVGKDVPCDCRLRRRDRRTYQRRQVSSYVLDFCLGHVKWSEGRKSIHHSTLLHLHLHRPAPLKRRPTPDDQSQIMCPQLRIVIRRIRICIPRTGEDSAALDTRLQSLFPQGQPLQIIQTISIGSAIKHRIFQQHLARASVEDRGLGIAFAITGV